MPASEPYPAATVSPASSPRAPQAWQRPALLAGAAALVCLPALALHWAGPWVLAASVAPVTWLVWQLCHRASPGAPPSQAIEPAEALAQPGQTNRLASQVVPVWQRNVDAAKAHSERSMAELLESFAGVSGHLDQALSDANNGPQLDMGAADALLDQHRGLFDQLMALTRAAVKLQRGALAELHGSAEELDAMALLAREVQNIGRATHLLALNTSVEANKAGHSGGGFMVVATEVRKLAAQSREAGTKLTRHVSSMQARLADLERQSRRENLDDDEEVDLRAEQAARAVVLGLLDSLGSVTQASRKLRLAGGEVQADLEKIFIALQSQDRLSQMLSSVTDDMARYSAWLHGATDPDAASPAQWLARLDKSYTMEEMRSSHHGTQSVDKAPSVEFF